MQKMNAKIVGLIKETAQIEVQYGNMDPVAIDLPARSLTNKEILELVEENMPRPELVERAEVEKEKLDYSAVENLLGSNFEVQKEETTAPTAPKKSNSVYVFQ